MFRRDGTGDDLDRVNAEAMKVEKLARITAVRRTVRSMLGYSASDHEVAAACTTDGGCRVMNAEYQIQAKFSKGFQGGARDSCELERENSRIEPSYGYHCRDARLTYFSDSDDVDRRGQPQGFSWGLATE